MLTSKLLVILLSALASSQAAPTTYDERQDGDLNVKVDLDNFVILMARPVSAVDVLGSMATLFADAKRTASQVPAQSEPQNQEAVVDKSKDLDDVSLDGRAKVVEPVEKPTIHDEEKIVVVVQEHEKSARSLEDLVRMSLKVNPAMEKEKLRGFSGKYKFVESVDEPQSLKLIGDAIENCGPGRSRDRFGICEGDGLVMQD